VFNILHFIVQKFAQLSNKLNFVLKSKLNMTNQSPSTFEFNPKILGHNIKKSRRRMDNMPQKELAEMIGVSRHTLIDYESGKRDIPLRKLNMIAKALNVSPIQLMGVSPPPHNLNNKQQEGDERTYDKGIMSSEREMFETHIERLREHISALEKLASTCAMIKQICEPNWPH